MIKTTFFLNVIMMLSLSSPVTSQTDHYETVLISIGKPVNMSSKLNYKGRIWSGEAVVDGNLSQDADACKCCASTEKGSGETFTVNLVEHYNISKIRIIGRSDRSEGALPGLTVYISTSANIQDGILVRELSNVEQEVFSISTNEEYQYVIVRTDIPRFVLICEIEVYTQACQDGYYDDCTKPCGQCKGDVTCIKTTGYCPDGCKPGYNGDTCSMICPDGYYDDCVKPCGQCKGNGVCDKVTGYCMNDCKQGYQGNTCSEHCPDGSYDDCFKRCGHCKDDAPCNKKNGNCHNGCSVGYKGNICSTSCDDRYYGDCIQHCGHCKGDNLCNKTTGHCEQGCESGYNYPMCTTECQKGNFGFNCKSVCGMCTDEAKCDIHTGDCPGGCVTGYTGRQCLKETYQTINTNSDTSVSIPVFVGALSGVIVVVLVVVLAYMTWRKRQRNETNNAERNGDTNIQLRNTSTKDDVLSYENIEHYTELESR